MTDELPSALISQRPGARIWWLEDDRQLCELLQARLEACRWRLSLFHRVADLAAALKLDEPDLLMLDRMLPGANGMDVLQQLRLDGYDFPVLILSALGSADERIEGLVVGANDYLPKPFRFRELIWRIERLLLARPPRLMQPSARRGVVPLGPLTLEPALYCLRDGSGAEVPLSRGDMALLMALVQVPGAVLSREQLAQATGSLVDASTSRTLDVRLSRLRRKLRQLSGGVVGIETVRGRGYRLTLPVHQPDTLLVACFPLAIPALGLLPPALGLLGWLVLAWALLCTAILWRQVLRPLAQLRRELQRQSLGPMLQPLPVEGIAPLRRCVERLNRLQAAQQRRLLQWQGRLSTLIHDQRAPLTRLMLRQEALRSDQPPARDQLVAMASDLQLLGELQQQLGGLADGCWQAGDSRSISLAQLCAQVVRHYRPESVRLDVPPLSLNLDPGPLQRVLHNLIDNALEHGSPPVLIGAQLVPGAVVVEVRDQGPALPAPNATSGGLGYAMALDFCRSHGGRLELEPQVGGGLLVRLWISSSYLDQDHGASHSVT